MALLHNLEKSIMYYGDPHNESYLLNLFDENVEIIANFNEYDFSDCQGILGCIYKFENKYFCIVKNYCSCGIDCMSPVDSDYIRHHINVYDDIKILINSELNYLMNRFSREFLDKLQELTDT